MEQTESHSADEKLENLRSNYQVEILTDWGAKNVEGVWQKGLWTLPELDKLHSSLELLANLMGGNDRFIRNLGKVTIKKAEIGAHGGEALAHKVSFSTKGPFSAWTVIHEMAHAWDANHKWKLSAKLEKYTRGFTSPTLSWAKRLIKRSDSGFRDQEDKPGRRGRLPGCNAAGYFYGDKPSGSNWNFNRKEDFAEAIAMYVGWRRENDLSDWAEARIKRYLLPNGSRDKNFGTDNWADYAKYFYPTNGDYATTKRWKFVDDLVNGRIKIQ